MSIQRTMVGRVMTRVFVIVVVAFASLALAAGTVSADDAPKPLTPEERTLLRSLLERLLAEDAAKAAKPAPVTSTAPPPPPPPGFTPSPPVYWSSPEASRPVVPSVAAPSRRGQATALSLPGIVVLTPQGSQARASGVESYAGDRRGYVRSDSAYYVPPSRESVRATFSSDSYAEVDLLSASAHSIDGIDRYESPGVLFSAPLRTYRDGAPVRNRTYATAPSLESDTATEDALGIKLPTPKTKLGMCLSGARDDRLKELFAGTADIDTKGFSANVGRLGTELKTGSFLGTVAGEYYEERNGKKNDLDINDAYANIEVPGLDGRYRAALRAGKHDAPFGLYGDSKWVGWAWLETPIVYGRFLPLGMSSLGVSFDLRLPSPSRSFTSVLSGSILNADGDNMTSFMGGRPNFGGHPRAKEGARFALGNLVFGGRWDAALEILGDPRHAFHFGASVAHGPNGAGTDGDTWLYGVHARLLWLHCRDKSRGGFVLEGEWAERQVFLGSVGTFSSAGLTDSGLYTSLVYNFAHNLLPCSGDVATGFKYETAYGLGDDFDATSGVRKSRDDSLLRCDRTRYAALVAWTPDADLPVLGRMSFNFEYVLDEADALGTDEHTFVLGVQFR